MSGRKCSGLHCPGCGDGDGFRLIALVVALVLIGAIIHAIWHTLVEAAEIAALTVLSVAALAVAGGIALLVYRSRSDRPRRPIALRAVVQPPPVPRPQLEEPSKPAIHHHHGPEFHIYGTDGQDAAAALIRKALTGENQP